MEPMSSIPTGDAVFFLCSKLSLKAVQQGLSSIFLPEHFKSMELSTYESSKIERH